MANSFSYQVIKDTTEQTVIKLTGSFDGSGQETDATRIQANTLSGALNSNTVPGLLSSGGTALPFYGLAVNRIWYTCSSGSDVQLFWKASTNMPITFLTGSGEYDSSGSWVTIPNNGGAGATGDIGVTTRGMVANGSYTIILELRKDNAHYQRGQFNDPAAFNYPPCGK